MRAALLILLISLWSCFSAVPQAQLLLTQKEAQLQAATQDEATVVARTRLSQLVRASEGRRSSPFGATQIWLAPSALSAFSAEGRSVALSLRTVRRACGVSVQCGSSSPRAPPAVPAS